MAGGKVNAEASEFRWCYLVQPNTAPKRFCLMSITFIGDIVSGKEIHLKSSKRKAEQRDAFETD